MTRDKSVCVLYGCNLFSNIFNWQLIESTGVEPADREDWLCFWLGFHCHSSQPWTPLNRHHILPSCSGSTMLPGPSPIFLEVAGWPGKGQDSGTHRGNNFRGWGTSSEMIGHGSLSLISTGQSVCHTHSCRWKGEKAAHCEWVWWSVDCCDPGLV